MKVVLCAASIADCALLNCCTCLRRSQCAISIHNLGQQCFAYNQWRNQAASLPSDPQKKPATFAQCGKHCTLDCGFFQPTGQVYHSELVIKCSKSMTCALSLLYACFHASFDIFGRRSAEEGSHAPSLGLSCQYELSRLLSNRCCMDSTQKKDINPAACIYRSLLLDRAKKCICVSRSVVGL